MNHFFFLDYKQHLSDVKQKEIEKIAMRGPDPGAAAFLPMLDRETCLNGCLCSYGAKLEVEVCRLNSFLKAIRYGPFQSVKID